MGQALERGMVLVMSIWNDQGGNMTWLDTGAAGPCVSYEPQYGELNANHTHRLPMSLAHQSFLQTTQQHLLPSVTLSLETLEQPSTRAKTAKWLKMRRRYRYLSQRIIECPIYLLSCHSRCSHYEISCPHR